ncbi:probable fucosyltransferase 9 [Selaginella moellendorffii]|uniref:probable fucosyltransferase 9 n=1 Tax=Selaginella moellendorffii TaxID=88036 RepID=UPI000D1C8AAE|nr:probable fucosyltransferase 9 [Selaginella moellendorffii]|eukprot:XP_024542443.1 probable fucosyltransferase 9 [Selaginella moellendorffii]
MPWFRLLGLVLSLTLALHFLLKAQQSPNPFFSSFILLNHTLPPRSSDENEQGLLPEVWKQKDDRGRQCLSRFQYQSYRRHPSSPSRPSDSLIQRLREYEELHARCAGEADKSPPSPSDPPCQFVVAVGYMGLGNKMISLVATFIYALLTNRVLLIAAAENMDRLFCEPFPQSSWLLPKSKMDLLYSLNDSFRFGSVVKAFGSGECNTSGVKYPGTVLVRITHEYDRDDTKFFCEEQQDVIRSQVPWVFVRSNVFYVPSLYYVPSFKSEMERLFPGEDAIFHHATRYLLHPSNSVWKRTTRFYDSYLAHAETLVGIQMRAPPGFEGVRKNYAREVLQCAVENRVLPNVTQEEPEILGETSEINHKNITLEDQSQALTSKKSSNSSSSSGRSIAVLVTSLNQAHLEALRATYLNAATEGGIRVSIHQPSHEEHQKTGETHHDEKALMEIFLLSLADTLITSPLSTFGYAAQGLAHLRPWLMWIQPNPEHPVCTRVFASDPCFLNFEPYSCDCNRTREETTLENLIRHCEEDEPNRRWVKIDSRKERNASD